MSDPHAPEVDVDPGTRRQIVTGIMRRQARLSIGVAAVFIALLIALPLFNLYAPILARQEIAGFSLTWLILGVLFFPITWLLSAVFVRSSESVEQSLVRDYASHRVIEAVKEPEA